MVLPDYESLMLPLLRVAGDGKEHRIGDVISEIADNLGVPGEERLQLLPSGKQTILANRVHWAKTYLVQAGLLEATKRAYFRITDRGRTALDQSVARIDNEYLSQFDGFIQFRTRTRALVAPPKGNPAESSELSAHSQTPDEILRNTVKQIDAALGKELLGRILAAPPSFFEGLIVRLLLAMGYGGSREDAGQIVGRSGDGQGNRMWFGGRCCAGGECGF
jgi:restriction system protein